MTTEAKSLRPGEWARALASVPTANAFAVQLCRLALNFARGHGARVSLVRDAALVTLAEEGRGLALLREDLAARARVGEVCCEDNVCALPLGCGVLEMFGADQDALSELTPWLPILGLALEGMLARDARRAGAHGRSRRKPRASVGWLA